MLKKRHSSNLIKLIKKDRLAGLTIAKLVDKYSKDYNLALYTQC
ncbi:MAG TPA: hypothetical protein PKD95_02740 [Candidatus Paceibacterota bacterium]|nr:hypothetical protein [Candidatus Paceibacterota bacterium]